MLCSYIYMFDYSIKCSHFSSLYAKNYRAVANARKIYYLRERKRRIKAPRFLFLRKCMFQIIITQFSAFYHTARGFL